MSTHIHVHQSSPPNKCIFSRFELTSRVMDGYVISVSHLKFHPIELSMTFDHANIYSNKNIRLGKERILRHVVLPYRLARSSKSYSYYERIEGRDE